VAVFEVSSVTSALSRMKMNFFKRCLAGVDMVLLVEECWLSKREDFTDNFVDGLTQLASVSLIFTSVSTEKHPTRSIMLCVHFSHYSSSTALHITAENQRNFEVICTFFFKFDLRFTS
jgi:hypothetical protein